MRKSTILKRISLLTLLCILLAGFCTGCGKIKILDAGSLKTEVPENKYDELGFGYKTSIDGDSIKITYALAGFLGGQIKYLHIDQIEKTLGEEKSLATNREKGTAYGLAYTSDFGEWNVQLDALQNYILGHKMTLQDVESIETYQKDENNPSVPAQSSDLSAACDLNIGDFLDVVKMTYQNTVKTDAMKIGLGENIRIYNTSKSAKITMSIIAIDYNQDVCYSRFESFDIKSGDTEIVSLKEAAESDVKLKETQNSVEGYEKYMIGRTPSDCTNVEVYSGEDGKSAAVPLPDTDLGEVCKIDLKYYFSAVSEAYSRAA